MQEKTGTQVLPPPAALISKNPLKWFKFFGPGAIVASVTIGSGELIFSSRGGSIFGYPILCVFLVIALMKWVFAYCSMRHMILSGAHPFERWSSLAGPRGWLPLFMIVIAIPCYPIWFSFLAGILGTACTWMFGFGTHYVWATIWLVVATLLLLLGTYDFLEKTQLVILGLMVGCMAIAVLYVQPDWLAVIKGFVVPQGLSYPQWAIETVPQLKDRSEWVEIMVYASAIGGASFDYLGYASFLRDKKWGLSHMEVAGEEQLQKIEDQDDHAARIWVKAAKVDTVVSFLMIIVLSAMFAILGTVILRPERLVPDGINLLNYQANFLVALSPWLLPLYKLAIFFAFFGSLYAGAELAFRVIFEYLKTLRRWRGRVPGEKLRLAVIGYIMLGAIAILWWSRFYPDLQLIDIVTPAAIYTGVLSCGFYGLATPWADRRFLPPGLRMSATLAVLNVVVGIAFTAMGLKALWDYDQVQAYVILAVGLAGCVTLAWRLKFLHRLPEGLSKSAEGT